MNRAEAEHERAGVFLMCARVVDENIARHERAVRVAKHDPSVDTKASQELTKAIVAMVAQARDASLAAIAERFQLDNPGETL